MSILTFSGSTDPMGQNVKFLEALPHSFPNSDFKRVNITLLPKFEIVSEEQQIPVEVIDFRNHLVEASSVIISTPEYLHNIPSTLKIALDWLASSGELVGKKVLPITYTPNYPRGEKAMPSLINCLKALDANIITTLNLHRNELEIDQSGKLKGGDQLEMLDAAIELLK